MEGFEQDTSLIPIVVGFLILFFASIFVQKKLRGKELIRQGQLPADGLRIPSVEERVAANAKWASGEIRSSGRALMLVLWLASIVWSLTIGVTFFKLLLSPTAQMGQIIVVGLFTLLGLGFVFFAIRVTIQHFRYGESWCRIRGKAGVLGETMTGHVGTKTEVEAIGDYTIELQCVETYSTGSGKNRTTKHEIRWQSKQTVPHLGKSSRAGIPFSFSLPTYPPETGYQLSRGKINWQLRISAPVNGVDYAAIFVVPVFRIDQGDKAP